MIKNKKLQARIKRHKRIRIRLHGDSQRPRLVLNRSLNNISAQLIDDIQNKVIFSLATYDKVVKTKIPSAGNIKSAVAFGELFANEAKQKGINTIVFDRAGYLYHGRVKAFAEALRKGGLQF